MIMTNLFQQRWRRANKTTSKYFKRLFNDHFLVFLVIGFGGVVLGYRDLLTAPQYAMIWHAPWLVWLVAGWLTLGLQFGSLVTYFKPADALFLMGRDREIATNYLSRALALSFGYASLWQAAAFGSILPILWRMQQMTWARLLVLGGFVLIYKWGLLMLERQRLLLAQHRRQLSENLVQRLIVRGFVPMVGIVLVGFLPQRLLIGVGCLMLVVLVALTRYAHLSSKNAQTIAMNWPAAIAQAARHEQRVFQFYATFSEVPNQIKTIKRRRYLDGLMKRLTKQRDVMYRLYLIRLARDTESLPLVLRLTAIGMVLIAALNQAPLWLYPVIAAAVSYLISFQLLPNYFDTQRKLWTRLMPVTSHNRQRAYLTLMGQVLGVVGIGLVLSGLTQGWLPAAVVLFGVLGMRVFLMQVYLPKQLKK